MFIPIKAQGVEEFKNRTLAESLTQNIRIVLQSNPIILLTT